MHKFPITDYKRFSELPFDKFNSFNFSIYIIDFSWNYLFVNTYVTKNFDGRGADLVGKNMWTAFPELAGDPAFIQLRKNMDKRIPINFVTISPINSKRLNVSGYPLEDCFYFSSSILPDKDDLIQELRNELGKRKL